MADGNRGLGLQLRSLIKSSGELEVSLARVPIPEPAADEILVRVEATPINPSDFGLLFGPADPSTIKISGAGDDAVLTAMVPPTLLRAVAGRFDQSLPVGNEGAGVVIEAGASAEAQRLLGKTVAAFPTGMYAQYRTVKAADALLLHADATPADGASCFVNPLTALGMVEVMRREGHTALVHTAAASNLGQMLNRICQADGVALVNIVRSAEQSKLLRDAGATYVCDSTSPEFMDELIAALVATGATIAFDAIGGGKLASNILTAMEAAVNRTSGNYSRYGSSIHKQVYIYGGPRHAPHGTGPRLRHVLGRQRLAVHQPVAAGRAGPTAELRQRVADELKTTFASHYTREIPGGGAAARHHRRLQQARHRREVSDRSEQAGLIVP